MKIFIVSAMIEPAATKEFWGTWLELADDPEALGRVVVVNGAKNLVDFEQTRPLVYQRDPEQGGLKGTYLCSGQIMGPVPAFSWGARIAVELGADLVCCFHDDMQFLEKGWDTRLRTFFAEFLSCVLAGFGGGVKLGRPGMYDEPYDPMSLARHDYVSNMRDAEAHGRREKDYPLKVSCLDGFSLIFRREFAAYAWPEIEKLGITHHAYDCYAGVLVKKFAIIQNLPHSCWMLPELVHHAGGRSAVANADYSGWALKQDPRGDQGFWEGSHRKVWEASRGILPLGWD